MFHWVPKISPKYLPMFKYLPLGQVAYPWSAALFFYSIASFALPVTPVLPTWHYLREKL